MNKVLFLDFDGVLFNTIKEVYLINRFIFLGEDFFSTINEENFTFFKKYKYLVYNIWMFYYFNPLVFSFDKNIEFNFIEKLKNRNPELEKNFINDFLNARYSLIKNHSDFWRNLETPYQFFYEIKNLYQEQKGRIVIVSKKNKTSILERFETYGLDFSIDDVFGYEFLDKYSSKGEFLSEYLELNNIEQAIFVDDNSSNLNSVNNKKIKTILASWGNCHPNSTGLSEVQAINEIKKFFNP